MRRFHALAQALTCLLSILMLPLLLSANAHAAINSATLSPATLPASGGYIYVNADITLPTQIQSAMAILNYNGVPGNQVYLFSYQGESEYSGYTGLQTTPDGKPAVITATIVVTDVNGLTTTAQTGEVIQAGDAEPSPVIADAVLSAATLPASGGNLTINAFLPGASTPINVEAEIYCNGIICNNIVIAPQGSSGIYRTTFPVGPNDSHAPQVYTALVSASARSVYDYYGVANRMAVGSAVQAGTKDITPPVIAQPLITPDVVSILGGTVTVSAYVTDPGADATGVSGVDAQIFEDGVGFSTVALFPHYGSTLYMAQVSLPGNTNVQAHTYTAFLQATDHAGNLSFAHVNGTCVQPPGDAQPPIIVTAHLRPATVPATGGLVKITATVTDSGGTNVGIAQITAYLLRDGVSVDGVATLYRLNASSDYEGSFSVGENRTHGAFHYTATIVAVDNLQN